MKHKFKGCEKGKYNLRIVITKSSVSLSAPEMYCVYFGSRVEGEFD